MNLLVSIQLHLPIEFSFTSLFNRFSIKLKHLAGNQKTWFYRPAKIFLGSIQLLITQRFSVRFGCPLFFRCPIANGCADADQGWTRVSFCSTDGGIDRFHIIAIFNFLHMPLISFKASSAVLGER